MMDLKPIVQLRGKSRAKVGLFPIKRLGGIHLCLLLKLFENPVENRF